MTRAEVLKLVALLQGAFPRAQLAEGTVEAYAQGLADLEAEEARLAIVALVRTSRFLPTIAEIREAVVEPELGLPLAEEAWSEVLAEIRRIGLYGVPEWSCGEIDRAVKAVGWRAMNESQNIAYERKAFLDAYKAIREERIYAAMAKDRGHAPALPPAPRRELTS